MNKVQNNSYATQLADKCNSMPLSQVPAINKPMQDIYLKAIPENPNETIPAESLTNHRIKSFKDLVVENQSGTFHKTLSILMLVATVAILATSIIFGVLVNPAFFVLGFLILFPAIIANFNHAKFADKTSSSVWLPIFDEISYIISAFKELDNDKFKEKLVPTRSALELFAKHETDIIAYIHTEKLKSYEELLKLANNDAPHMQPQKEFHKNQIDYLDRALNQLEVAKLFLEATK